MKSFLKKVWVRSAGLNGLLLLLYLTLVFLTSVIVSNSFTSYYLLIALLLGVVFFAFVCPAVIKFLSKRQIVCTSPKQTAKFPRTAAIRSICYLLPLCIFLFYYISWYPGSFSPDSVNQYGQTVSGQYNDWHPVLHTLLAFKLPLTLTGGWVGSIVLFQVIVFSAVLGYSFDTIYQYTNAKYTIFSMAFILCNPQTDYLSIHPWKDVSFAVGALLLLTYAFRIYITKGEWIRKPLNAVLFVTAAALTTLLRHNALLFTGPLTLAALLYVTKKRGVILCLGILTLIAGIKFPLYSALGVEKPDQRQVETLGLPMTVIGAAVTYTPELLDEEILEFAYQVAPKEVWEEKYSYGTYNSVKWDDRTNNDVIEKYGASKVISMMFRCMIASGYETCKALTALTNAVYTITDEYNIALYPGVAQNEFGITYTINGHLAGVCNAYRDVVNDYFSYPIFHLGITHLLLILSVLSKCQLTKWRDWKKILFIIPVFFYNYGTTLLLTSYADAERFFFYTFLLLPTLLMVMFRENDERNMGTCAHAAT